MLYPAHKKSNVKKLAEEWQKSIPRFVLLPERGNENNSLPRVRIELTTDVLSQKLSRSATKALTNKTIELNKALT